MKQVLIVDESSLFRDYLREKLEENSVEVIIGISVMDGISKMRVNVPDLIVLDYHLGGQGYMELLKEKKANPNTVNTPVIIMAQRLEQRQLIALIPYNVKKVFTKPVKIDALFHTFSELLGVDFNIDENPSIVEVHINDNIIFIEIAQGLNRDKLDLLRFKIIELIDLYEIRIPKVIIMLSDMKLSYADVPNMRKLLNTVIHASRAKPHFIRILTREDFVRQFIMGQKDYSGIKVVTKLQYAINDLTTELGKGNEFSERTAEIIGDRLLKAKTGKDREAMVLKFHAEEKNINYELMKNSLQNLRIAVIDDDIIIQELIKNTFQKARASVYSFTDGKEFLSTVNTGEFDLAFLDLNMPNIGGFEVLKALRIWDKQYPVIIISSDVQRKSMIRAFQMGVKSYMIKPLNPGDLFRKSIEILKVNY